MFTRVFLLVFLLLAAVMTVGNRREFFETARYEEGDLAANALQIERAKHLHEIYGNYSRWGFHHPGPAFFYVYAAGELLLHDTLSLTPAPHNAHIYTGLLLQLVFFAAAVALVSRASSQPWLVAAILVLIAVIHFHFAARAWFSIWPPDVLVMPFLCLIVAAAAVSFGQSDALPWLVAAGGFLIHGHIAQPLFVLPLGAGALAALLWHRHRRRISLIDRGDILPAALGAGFTLPLIIDLFRWSQSNAYAIFLHLKFHSDAAATVYQSFLYLLSYFVYADNQETLNTLSPNSYAIFAGRWFLLVLWAVLLVFSIWAAIRARISSPTLTFARRLLVFFPAAVALDLVWGMRQDGGFTSFNSTFNFGLMLIAPFAAVLAATAMLRNPIPRAVSVGAMATAAVVAAFTTHATGEAEIRGAAIHRNLPAVLRTDPLPGAPKLLEFAPGDWFEAVTLGLALQRARVPFYVHPAWSVMFGRDKVFENQGHAMDANRLSRWRIGRRLAGGRPLTSEFAIDFPTAAPLGALPASILFGAQGNHSRYNYFGFCAPGEARDWSWTEAAVAAVEFTAAPVATDVKMAIEADPLIAKRGPHQQTVRIFVNGEKVGEPHFQPHETVELEISAPTWNRHSPVRIVFELPDATAPSSLTLNPDRRPLALAMYRIAFRTIASERPPHDALPRQ
jgi:hypothetical protein